MGCVGSKEPLVVVSTALKKDLPIPIPKGHLLRGSQAAIAKRQEMASVRIQTCMRGGLGRARARAQRQTGAYAARKHPCERYRVDVNAADAGDCLCGFAKLVHSTAAFKCAAKPVKRVNSHALRKRMKKREVSLCQHYKVNMHAATVGECIHCGRPRAEHSEAALKATLKEGPTTEKRTDADIQSHMKSPAKDNLAWECAKYVVNLQAAVTGECICGRSRGEHTKEALAASRKSNDNELFCVDEDTLRVKMQRKQFVSCVRYQLDLNPSVPYGQCVCGALKASHTDSALRSSANSEKAFTPRDDAEVRRKMVQRATCECTSYKLDVSPNAPFGQCVCGFPKAMHTDVALKGSKMASPLKLQANGLRVSADDELEFVEEKPVEKLVPGASPSPDKVMVSLQALAAN